MKKLKTKLIPDFETVDTLNICDEFKFEIKNALAVNVEYARSRYLMNIYFCDYEENKDILSKLKPICGVYLPTGETINYFDVHTQKGVEFTLMYITPDIVEGTPETQEFKYYKEVENTYSDMVEKFRVEVPVVLEGIDENIYMSISPEPSYSKDQMDDDIRDGYYSRRTKLFNK